MQDLTLEPPSPLLEPPDPGAPNAVGALVAL